MIYGAATLVHGSGFLAVFVAGILIGDRHVPHRPEIDAFLASLGGLAEIAMFVALGLTIDLTALFDSSAWYEGLVLAALLAFVDPAARRRDAAAPRPARPRRAAVRDVERAEGRRPDPARRRWP